jgi:hypothetical protein
MCAWGFPSAAIRGIEPNKEIGVGWQLSGPNSPTVSGLPVLVLGLAVLVVAAPVLVPHEEPLPGLPVLSHIAANSRRDVGSAPHSRLAPHRQDCQSSCLYEGPSSPARRQSPRPQQAAARTANTFPHRRTLPTGGWGCTRLEPRPTSARLAFLVPLLERALLPLPKTTDRSADPKGMPAGSC